MIASEFFDKVSDKVFDEGLVSKPDKYPFRPPRRR